MAEQIERSKLVTIEGLGVFLEGVREEFSDAGMNIDERLAQKADIVHDHNDMYYTESEINTMLEEKANKEHDHSQYLTEQNLSGYATESWVEEKGYKTTDNDTTYTLTQDSKDGHKLIFTPSNGEANTITIPDNDTTYEVVTTSVDGLMSKDDKIKLNGVAEGANKTVVDTTLNNTSVNPISNKAVTDALSEKANSTHDHDGRYYTESEMDDKLAAKSNEGHTHSEYLTEHQSLVDYAKKVDIPKTLPASDVSTWAKQANKPTYTASEVGADVSGAAASALSDAKSYTDSAIGDLINGAPTTLDTLGEIATAMEDHISVVDALDKAIGTKANASDLASHTGNKSNPHGVTAAQVGLGNVGNFKAVSTVASQGLTNAEKSNARANIGAGTSSFSGNYNDLSNKPTIPTNTWRGIQDNLTSTSTTESLSANQGKILKGYVDNRVVISSTEPSGQRSGDFWLKAK